MSAPWQQGPSVGPFIGPPESPSADGNVTAKPSPVQGNGQHVLVVVDDAASVELLATTPELAGYRVRTAGRGTEARARLMEYPFDLVVLDVTLPDMEGLSRWGRRPAATDRPPVLFPVACE